MMSKKSPQLRFEGFTDDWEERKLSSGLREYTDRVIVEDDKEYYQISVRNNFGGITLRGSKMGNKIGRKRQAKINLTKYPQTLIFTRQTVEQGGIGWVDKYCDGAIVTENMPTISLDTSVFSKHFLTNLFQTRIFYKNAILDNIEGGSAQIAIHESKFLSSTLLFPNLDEQEKIGQFFKQLDDTIDLHQRKLDLLKEQKKGYLQKMFPKNGAKVPELRFAGFADDWELRNVREICRISTGKSNTQDREEQGKFPFYVRSPIIEKSTKYLFDEEAVLTVGDGVGTGKVFHYVHGKYDLHQRVYRMFSFTHVNAKYFYYYFSKKFFDRVMAMTAKNSVDSVRLEMISDMEITIPQLEEQEKIVKILSTLDQQITLHQRKLDLLKEQKKGFLQTMFAK